MPGCRRSIAERVARTRRIHHNHAAVWLVAPVAESLTFAPAALRRHACHAPGITAMFDVQFARRQMIEQQVRAWEVLDLKVLEAWSACRARSSCRPPTATSPSPTLSVPLGHGQCMLRAEARRPHPAGARDPAATSARSRSAPAAASSPPASARLARSGPHDRDLFPDFVADAPRDNLARTGAHNVDRRDGRRDAARPSATRYDVIAVTGSLPVYDARFERALAVGGRLFVVVGQGPMLEARRVTRTGPGRLVAGKPVRDGDARPDPRPGAAEVRLLSRPAPGASQSARQVI